MVDLDVANTGIADTIPSWFWSTFSHLEYLNISHNQIHGNLTETTLSMSTSPQAVFDLSFNHFSGPLPIIYFAITFLDLSNNFFSGSLELFLCHRMEKPKQLEVLNLGNNLLSGVIPDCWRNWQSLIVLNFENNNLSGGIPSSLEYLSQLIAVNIRKNKLSENLSMSPLNLTELVILDISENEFRGSIPTWIGRQLRSLKVLNLRLNKFVGSIPYELCELTSIQILDLGHNNLFGTIPRCFNKFRVMATKDTSNELSIRYYTSSYTGDVIQRALAVMKGEEVEYSTILGLVKILDLSSNNFSGEIPNELMALLGLLSLNMSGNNLTGRIPEKIGEMTFLESLDLSLNRLSGEIPWSMSSLNFLSRFNLSYNSLNGRIPSSTQLQSLDESSFIGNRLCGAPLRFSCDKQAILPRAGNGDKGGGDGSHEVDWGFVISILLGFAVGFWAVVTPLFVSRFWRIMYFRFLYNTWYRCNSQVSQCV